MNLMSYNLSTFGSRFSLIFDSTNKRLKHGVLGMFLENTSELICGVKSSEGDSYLPFCDKDNNFQMLYMETSQNSVTYKGISKDCGYDMFVTFTSPFAPKDEKLMIAPFFYVDIKIKKNTRPHNLVRVKKNIDKGTFVFGLKSENLSFLKNNDELTLEYNINAQSRFVLGDFARTLKIEMEKDGKPIEQINCKEYIYSKDVKINNDNLIEVDFDLSKGDEQNISLVWATYHEDDFIKACGQDSKFLYKDYFNNYKDVLKFAIENRETIMKKSEFYDSMFETSSLSQSYKDFIAQTYQSYKLNTLFVKMADGEKSFTVWEGNCMYNSTVDVEYNNGLFYYTMCPEVLEGMFTQWANTVGDTGYISHDLGWGFTYRGDTNYSHPMKVEENCNFILMLYTYANVFNRKDLLEKHFDVLKKLADFMIDADTTGNGIPNEGTSNTIDDAIPAVQHAKEQTYLALKTASSLQVFAKISEIMNDLDYAKKSEERSFKILETVDRELWKGDHYGVCLDTSQDGYKTFLTNEDLSGEMQGRDEHSIFAENGMLYPFMADFKFKNFPIDKMKQNIYNSNNKCQTVYGCNHSENSDSAWISQNLWRDFSAAYLDCDLLENVDKYWEFQKIMNTNGRLNLFIDTFGENALWYYPRGLTSIGVIYASLRLKIDGFSKTIEINPIRKTMKIPLTMFADWDNLVVPVVTVLNNEIKIENEHLLKDYKINIVK